MASVLVVDDDPEILTYIADLLTNAGHQVICAKNGAIALDLLRRAAPPDLIIADLRMPRVDGMKLLRELRHSPNTAHIPVIILSGDHDRTVDALDLGANDYMTKPIEGAELVARANSHLRVARAAEKWRQGSFIDPLTGLLNRRGFTTYAVREVERAIRQQTSLAIVFLDIDRFKQVNDLFGHTFGDQVLCYVAEALDQNLRGCDLAARWGGDEFVLLLPCAGRSSAKRVAHRIQDRTRLLITSGIPPDFGVSVGIACLFEDVPSSAENIVQALIKTADAAMYRTKSARRRPNRFADGSRTAVKINGHRLAERTGREIFHAKEFRDD